MNLVTDILLQPLLLCWAVFHRLKATLLLIRDSIAGPKGIDPVAVTQLFGWLVLVMLILEIVFLMLRFIFQDLLGQNGPAQGFFRVIGNFLWRLLVVLVVYLALALVVAFFLSIGHIVVTELNYAPAR